MILSHTWTIRAAQIAVSVSTPKTIIQYVANANYPAEILDFMVSQGASVTSAMERVRLGKITVAGTGGVAGAIGTNISRWGSADDTLKAQLGTALTAVNLAVEPTYTELPREFDFNVLNGSPGGNCSHGALYVPPGGMVGIRLAGLVAGTWNVEMLVHEFA